MTKRNITILAIVVVSLIASFFLFQMKKESGKDYEVTDRDLTKAKKTVFFVATRETGSPKFDIGSWFSIKKKSEEEFIQRWVSSDDEIKKAAVEIVRELYKSFDDMDFSEAVAKEMVFVKNTQPRDNITGYYLIILRNSKNEIMARSVLNLMEEKEGNQLVESGNVEPFPPAFTDPETQDKYRRAEKYSLTDSFPRISEEEAFKLASQHLEGKFSNQGLTNLFLFLPTLDNYFQIGVPFSPYYKFVVEGDEKKTIWINSETGVIVDYQHLDSEAQEFEKMMVEEQINTTEN